MNRTQSLRGLLSAFPMLFLVTCHAAPAFAQSANSAGIAVRPQVGNGGSATAVRLDNAAIRHFDTAFGAISDQAHVLIVTEGTPMKVGLTDQQVEDLRRTLPADSASSARDVIMRLAAAYDYDVEQYNVPINSDSKSGYSKVDSHDEKNPKTVPVGAQGEDCP